MPIVRQRSTRDEKSAPILGASVRGRVAAAASEAASETVSKVAEEEPGGGEDEEDVHPLHSVGA